MFWLRKINAALVMFSNWGTILFMGVIALVIPYEVFGRYVLHKMSIWSGEVSTFSLVWASMLGGAAGLKKGYQVGMTIVVESAPPAVSKVLQVAGLLSMLVFLAAMTYFGAYQTFVNLNQTSPAMGIVMALPYSALPVGFFIMFLLTVESFLLLLGAPDRPGGKTC